MNVSRTCLIVWLGGALFVFYLLFSPSRHSTSSSPTQPLPTQPLPPLPPLPPPTVTTTITQKQWSPQQEDPEYIASFLPQDDTLTYETPYCRMHLTLPQLKFAFSAHQSAWTQMGDDDPWWAVLTGFPRGTTYTDTQKRDFYATGSGSVEPCLNNLKNHVKGMHLPSERKLALDFGCGLGRISNALTPHFDHVVCADQSWSMLDTAEHEVSRLFPEHGSRISFLYMQPDVRDSLAYPLCPVSATHKRDCWKGFPISKTPTRFDFIFSVITLQHMVPPLQLWYMRQFCLHLNPGGVGFVQIPVQMDLMHFEYTCAFSDFIKQQTMQMHYLQIEIIQSELERVGCRIISTDVGSVYTGVGHSHEVFFERQ
eukprot:TRINITY_DN3195_c0_g1_i1.p1 TRINITY_DN3195_c0_g1~~TRINITY_DN3195_c0_g1_i1.p1  ORF type:complete len:368 (+),score=43.23 TRINITY_DN3195_c0_g1_i1:84-1187(+)